MNCQPVSINTSFQAKQPFCIETLERARQRVAKHQNRIIGIRKEINRQAGIHVKLEEHQPNETVDKSVRKDIENAWEEIFGALGAAMPIKPTNIPKEVRIFINRIKNYAQNNGYKHIPIKDDTPPKDKVFINRLNLFIDKLKADSERTNKKGV